MPPHSDDCLRDEDFNRLYNLVEKVFGRMDKFIDEIHQTNLSDANRENRIIILEKDLDRAFTEIRRNKDDIKMISDWRQRFAGGIKVILTIPVLCVVITTGIAIYQLLT